MKHPIKRRTSSTPVTVDPGASAQSPLKVGKGIVQSARDSTKPPEVNESNMERRIFNTIFAVGVLSSLGAFFEGIPGFLQYIDERRIKHAEVEKRAKELRGVRDLEVRIWLFLFFEVHYRAYMLRSVNGRPQCLSR